MAKIEFRKKDDIPEIQEEMKKEKKEEIAVQEKSVMQSIETDKNGMIKATDMNQQWVLAQAYAKSGLLPKHFDTPQKVMTAMQFCAELGLKPITGMRQIYIVNGSPSLWGDLPLAVCNNSKELEDHEEFLYDHEYNKISFENKNLHLDISLVAGAVCRVKRKGRSYVEKIFTVVDAQKANLLDAKFGSEKKTWREYPKQMLIYRARTAALKAAFPDMLSGVNISEYDDYAESEIIDVSPEKEALLADLGDVLMLVRETDPEFNKAREMDSRQKYIKSSDIRKASEEEIMNYMMFLKNTYLNADDENA